MTAACVGQDPEMFFADDPEPARRVCARCNDSGACLAAALALGDAYGVRGGYTATERLFWFAPPPPVDAHGEHRTYVAGCRCVECRAAQASYVSEWRAAATGRENVETRVEQLELM
jgi:hypothetical protein